jgi:hypothetical protein
MNFTFGDIVVVEHDLIGVVVKDWVTLDTRSTPYKEIVKHEVYVREFNCIKEYDENEMQRYMVRHKCLNEEEMEYQRNAILGR